MQAELQTDMARRRALLTDRERELLAGVNVDEKNYQYQAATRVRNKINDELPEDMKVLEEHHPELYEELREVVCDD
jgi:ribosome-associated toxin RatA of RatAB toxin-antitoxin module